MPGGPNSPPLILKPGTEASCLLGAGWPAREAIAMSCGVKAPARRVATAPYSYQIQAGSAQTLPQIV